MTTILVDIKKGVVYADKRTTHSRFHYATIMPSETETITYTDVADKIKRLPDGKVFAACGDVAIIDKAFRELEGGLSISDPTEDDCTFLILHKKHNGIQVDRYKAVVVPCWWSDKFKWEISTVILSDGCVTMGSGGDYAKGAFYSTKDGSKSIQAASDIDKHTGSEVFSLNICCEEMDVVLASNTEINEGEK